MIDPCAICGRSADVVQRSTGSPSRNYYCRACLAVISPEKRPFGWDNLKQRPQEPSDRDSVFWVCEFLNPVQPMIERIDRQRRMNVPL